MSVAKRVSQIAEIVKWLYDFNQITGTVTFYTLKDKEREDLKAFSHCVKLSEDDKEHLNAGGKLVVVHACGKELHVRM